MEMSYVKINFNRENFQISLFIYRLNKENFNNLMLQNRQIALKNKNILVLLINPDRPIFGLG